MLSFSSRQRYFLYRQPTDMREGFNGLSGLVRQHIDHELLSGDAFIFLNKRRDRVKIISVGPHRFCRLVQGLGAGYF